MLETEPRKRGHNGKFGSFLDIVGYIWQYPDIKPVITKISKNNRGYIQFFGYNRQRISKKTRFKTSF